MDSEGSVRYAAGQSMALGAPASLRGHEQVLIGPLSKLRRGDSNTEPGRLSHSARKRLDGPTSKKY
jgi:hypothetical protein